MIYEGSMHEFFYQMRNAKSVIKKTWPWLSVIELKNHRFITFVKSNGKADCIDLNNKNDVYGLFVFNGRKSPLFVDMTNIETVVSFYLNDASK